MMHRHQIPTTRKKHSELAKSASMAGLRDIPEHMKLVKQLVEIQDSRSALAEKRTRQWVGTP